MKCNYIFYIAALSFIPGYSFGTNTKPIEFDQGPEISSGAWSQRMKANGDTLKQHKVRQMFLVHGTFFGDDPSGLINFLGSIDPDHKVPILPGIIQGLKQGQKELTDIIARDEGNYTNEYAKKLCNWGLGRNGTKNPVKGQHWAFGQLTQILLKPRSFNSSPYR